MDRVSGYIHAHTLYGAVRPFGCNVMFSSYTPTEGPRLYMVDPSGVSWVSMAKDLELLFYHITTFTSISRITVYL